MKGEYEQSQTIEASSDAIFDFVADVRNMPKYLPTTNNAQSQGEDRVRVQGEVHGHQYDADGYLRRNPDTQRLEWGADERYYAGWLDVQPQGSHASQVTVHISFRGGPPGADEDEGPSDEQIMEGLTRALDSIRNHVTGQGGKEEPSMAT